MSAHPPSTPVVLSGCPFDRRSLEETVELVHATIAAGDHHRLMLVDAAQLARMRRDPELAQHVLSADGIQADGQTLVWLSRLADGHLPERVTGIDLLTELAARAPDAGHRLFLLGGLDGTAERAARVLEERHGAGILAGHRSGVFAPEEEPGLVEEIVRSGAHMLFTGLPTPMEERFLHDHAGALRAVPFVTGIGSGIEFLAGDVRRAPRWMQRAGLEWLHRFAQEPRRKWRGEVVEPASLYVDLFRERWRR